MMPEFRGLLSEAVDTLGWLEQDRILLTIALEQLAQRPDDLESRLSVLLGVFNDRLDNYLDHVGYLFRQLRQLIGQVSGEKTYE
jgi:hypothetical protein